MNVTHHLRQLAEKATPGEWANWGRHVMPAAHFNRRLGGSTDKKQDHEEFAHLICLVSGKYQPDEANAAYIAAASPATIIKLLDAQIGLMAALKEIAEKAEKIATDGDHFEHVMEVPSIARMARAALRAAGEPV